MHHPEAERELGQLPEQEQTALLHAVEKLQVHGPSLPYPHQSAVRGVAGLRELRPRAGRSPWRGLYGRVGQVFVIVAIAPEAESDRRGFDRVAATGAERLRAIEP